MIENVTEVTTSNLLNEVAAKLPQGFRFVTISCTDLGEAHDLIYHFDQDYTLYNLRLLLPKGQELPSISRIYLAAVIIENEIKDLFGIPVTGLVIDYEGRFLLSENAPLAPLNKPAAALEQAEKEAPAND
ncbi:MAG: NADH-quinone oxidoreductase subunit C [Thermodesulfobacteriota bacterium]